jgi:hypothetical protein
MQKESMQKEQMSRTGRNEFLKNANVNGVNEEAFTNEHKLNRLRRNQGTKKRCPCKLAYGED